MLAVYDHEYRGALALKFQTFGISAFAMLNTRLPDGQDGFSLAASIFGEFNLPLGFGFFLTGVGGVIGVNRTINTEALRDVLVRGPPRQLCCFPPIRSPAPRRSSRTWRRFCRRARASICSARWPASPGAFRR